MSYTPVEVSRSTAIAFGAPLRTLAIAMPRRGVTVVVPENTTHALVQPLFVTTNASDHAVAAPSHHTHHIDVIMASMQRSERKRKPSSFLHDAFYNSSDRLTVQYRMQTAFEMASTSSSDVCTAASAWTCPGCGQTDRSKLVMSEDKSGWACAMCGVCDTGSNLQESTYDSHTRTTKCAGLFGDSLTAVEFEDAGKRRQARLANESSCGTVPTSLRQAQHAVVRRATMENVLSETLCARDRRRMEKAMTHVNSLFRSSGLDPDSNPMCIAAFKLTSQIFVKATMHILACTNKNHTCMASMMRHADFKLVGKACVSHVLLIAEKAAANGEAFESIGPHEVKTMGRKLMVELAAYNKAVGVAREAEATISRLVDASHAAISIACDDNDVELDDDEGIGVPATTSLVLGATNEEDAQSIDAFLERLSMSLMSAKTIGWIDERILAIAQKHIGCVACYDWIANVRAWPADVVAAIICMKTLTMLRFSTGNMNTILKKLAKQHRLTIETVHNAMGSMPTPRA